MDGWKTSCSVAFKLKSFIFRCDVCYVLRKCNSTNLKTIIQYCLLGLGFFGGWCFDLDSNAWQNHSFKGCFWLVRKGNSEQSQGSGVYPVTPRKKSHQYHFCQPMSSYFVSWECFYLCPTKKIKTLWNKKMEEFTKQRNNSEPPIHHPPSTIHRPVKSGGGGYRYDEPYLVADSNG